MTFTVVMPPACAFWIPGSRGLIESSARTSGWIGPLLSPPDYITPPSPAAVAAAVRLEYWTRKTHTLCQPARCAWVRCVLLAFHRLGLPGLVQLKVLDKLINKAKVEGHRVLIFSQVCLCLCLSVCRCVCLLHVHAHLFKHKYV